MMNITINALVRLIVIYAQVLFWASILTSAISLINKNKKWIEIGMWLANSLMCIGVLLILIEIIRWLKIL